MFPFVSTDVLVYSRRLLFDSNKVIAASDVRCNIVLLMRPKGFNGGISVEAEGRDDASFDWFAGRVTISSADANTVIVVSLDGAVSRFPASVGLAARVYAILDPPNGVRPDDTVAALLGIVDSEVLDGLK